VDKIYLYFNNELLKNFIFLTLKLFKENKENKSMTEIMNKNIKDYLKIER